MMLRFLAMLLPMLLSACGVQGDLYLPAEEKPASSPRRDAPQTREMTWPDEVTNAPDDLAAPF